MNESGLFYSPGVPPAGASRLPWPIMTQSLSVRPWRSRGAVHIVDQNTARWRWKVASPFSCGSLAPQMWLHWTAVLLLCQTWIPDKFGWIAIFPSTCTVFDPRITECYEGMWKRKRKVLEIFSQSKVFGVLNAAESFYSCFIVPHFFGLHTALWSCIENKILWITCARLQSAYTILTHIYCSRLLHARIRCSLV